MELEQMTELWRRDEAADPYVIDDSKIGEIVHADEREFDGLVRRRDWLELTLGAPLGAARSNAARRGKGGGRGVAWEHSCEGDRGGVDGPPSCAWSGPP